MRMLEEKVAVVTGASSGIGRAAARLFAREGARLVVTARRASELDMLVAEINEEGGEAIALPGDIANDNTGCELVETAVKSFGGLDIAFNNAGTLGEMAPTADVSLAGWRETIDVNLTSAFACARHQLPAMLERGGGSIVFTSTFVGHVLGFPGMAAYAAAKAGIVGLARVIAAEYGPQGIRANAMLVGGTDTPMGRIVADTPETQSFVASLHALKRIAHPDEIAGAALFLASEQARFVTGSAFSVDGGVTITRT
ncbi:SDR family oxidoreductase [Parvibaculum sp.]|uniref:SDR family oxidoreductase n=1 Tax=Parvibaculum sp. TaxID=2024848 RepID=UPI001B17E328|nr:SDR family oxidoreductase [Parvibaculum sp.]MBO6634189.1 SDR family oxidoreductase [Parvibaculum sp.]MBO6676950.1 SDR family oxidoreductase [Parvibaculum sp.]MBO6686326.1 SDR family oxidoreductase [Parvibaculum sp.]MBO6904083.1 SDR family oxidoreductase [Parvibaculum sp.]